ncbi:Aclacinomycin methylesterase RdmC [Halioglobus japonicus]|nr:Aclacinomycin methylesterase RdmC [Halioglobus japonicus]
MSERYVHANGIKLAYDEFGQPGQPVILLIMGLGTQMIAWPEAFCQALAMRGYRVIRFDNRDIGLSEKMEGGRLPHVLKMAAFSRFNLPLNVPYKLQDMAQDAVGLMDALDIDAAHIVGASMGGMIAQLVAGHFPFRVLSLTSIMSSSGRKNLPGAKREVALHMLRRPKRSDPEALQEYAIRTWRLIGSPGYQPSDAALREKLTRSFERSYYPAGHSRHMAAIMASGDRLDVLKKVVAPTLVIHGKDDPLVPMEGGIDTARLVRGARLELFEGMGHDLPEPLLPQFVDMICETAALRC